MDQGKLSAGVVVVHDPVANTKLLMLRAYRNWDFPKGLVEAGEQPFAAAVREVEEETTLNQISFPWGQVHIETGPYHRGKVARYYIGESSTRRVDLPINPTLGRPEHNEYRWVTVDQAYQLAAPRVQQVVAWAKDILRSD